MGALRSNPSSVKPPRPGRLMVALGILSLLLLGACSPGAEAEASPTPEESSASATLVSSPTPAATSTKTPTPSPSSTPEPTLPPTPSIPMLSTLGEDLLCRFGPGEVYALSGSFLAEEIAPVIGQSADGSWYVLEHPRLARRFCWLAWDQVQIEGDLDSIPVAPLPANIVIGVSVDMAPTVMELSPCTFPATFQINYSIQTSGPLTVTYRKVANSGTIESETVNFQSGVPLSFRETLKVNSTGNYFYRIEVTAPNSISGESSAEVVCP